MAKIRVLIVGNMISVFTVAITSLSPQLKNLSNYFKEVLMEFSMQEAGNTLEVMMQGRFTFSENQKFKLILQQALRSKPAVVIFDLTKVDFIDSAGLGMLLLAKDEMDSMSTSILLRGAQGQVKKMLNVSCFEVLFGMA